MKDGGFFPEGPSRGDRDHAVLRILEDFGRDVKGIGLMTRVAKGIHDASGAISKRTSGRI